eukprot:GCRY01003865.1.p2 GENE.GCRY01003865.1~~GCRY01003865.1.p2  ORF type:complete len:143 (-),score=2.60 GCRY01003865.1:1265-1693(-)
MKNWREKMERMQNRNVEVMWKSFECAVKVSMKNIGKKKIVKDRSRPWWDEDVPDKIKERPSSLVRDSKEDWLEYARKCGEVKWKKERAKIKTEKEIEEMFTEGDSRGWGLVKIHFGSRNGWKLTEGLRMKNGEVTNNEGRVV